jgi:hypothetical protein
MERNPFVDGWLVLVFNSGLFLWRGQHFSVSERGGRFSDASGGDDM